MLSGFGYPYDPKDGREDPNAPSRLRVLRGGSFFDNAGNVRCAVRHNYSPDWGSDYIGFRVVVSPGF